MAVKRVRVVVQKKNGSRRRDDTIHEFTDKEKAAEGVSETMATGYEVGHVILMERGVIRAIPFDNIDEVYIEPVED